VSRPFTHRVAGERRRSHHLERRGCPEVSIGLLKGFPYSTKGGAAGEEEVDPAVGGGDGAAAGKGNVEPPA